MNLFIPKMYQKDIFNINYQKLKKAGYKILIFDLDNTIGSIKENVCNKKTKDFLNLLALDFQIIISSNSFKKRVEPFLKGIKCDYYSFSLKPTLRVLRKIKKKYGIAYDKMVIIGDQILTDVLVGNRKKLLTILVDPIKDIDFKVTKFNRKLEKFILKKNKIIRGKYYEKK